MSYDPHPEQAPEPRDDKSAAAAKSSLERRHARRYALEDMPLHYRILSSEERVTEAGAGRIIDVSSDGVRFESVAPIASGRDVRLLIDWPLPLRDGAQLQLVIEGTVVRSNETETSLLVARHVFKMLGET
jgi:hypothetical protein